MSTKDRIRTAASDSDADTYIVDPKTRKTYLKGQFLGKVSLSSSRNSVAKAPTIHRRLRVRAFTGRFRALLRTEGHDNERSIRRKDRLEEPPNETASERKGSTSVSSRGASPRTFFCVLDVDGDCGPSKSQSREHRRL